MDLTPTEKKWLSQSVRAAAAQAHNLSREATNNLVRELIETRVCEPLIELVDKIEKEEVGCNGLSIDVHDGR